MPTVVCSSCRTRYRAPEDFAKPEWRCKKCGHANPFHRPEPDPEPELLELPPAAHPPPMRPQKPVAPVGRSDKRSSLGLALAILVVLGCICAYGILKSQRESLEAERERSEELNRKRLEQDERRWEETKRELGID